MLEFKFDTQLLIEGRNLSEDEIFDYITKILRATACSQWAMKALSKFIFTQIRRGKLLNMPPHWAKFTI